MCNWSLFPPQTNNALEAQRVSTEFAFRKRIRDLERAYDELKWQEQNVNVTSLVFDHNLGWELNPKGWFLCGRLLDLSVVSVAHVRSLQHPTSFWHRSCCSGISQQQCQLLAFLFHPWSQLP